MSEEQSGHLLSDATGQLKINITMRAGPVQPLTTPPGRVAGVPAESATCGLYWPDIHLST